MSGTYKKLWKLLIDKDMTRTDLQHLTGLSDPVMTKLAKGESVALSSLMRICTSLECALSDIMDTETVQKRRGDF